MRASVCVCVCYDGATVGQNTRFPYMVAQAVRYWETVNNFKKKKKTDSIIVRDFLCHYTGACVAQGLFNSKH